MASAIDATKPVAGSPTTQSVRDNFATAASEITALQAAATSLAPLASPTFTGDPKAPTPATADSDTSIATTAYVQAQGYATAVSMTAADNLRVLKAGDAISGGLTVAGNVGIGTTTPGAPLHVGATATSGGAETLAATGIVSIPADTYAGLVVQRSGVVNPEVLTIGVNQAGLYGEIQTAQNSVAVNTLYLNRQGGGVLIGSPAGGSKGTGTINATQVYAAGVLLTSDADLKTDIAPLPSCLPLIAEIEPKSFRWKPLPEPDGDIPGAGSMPPGFAERLNRGFLAQDVAKVLGGKAEDGVDLGSMVAVLWAAVKELNAKVDALSAPSKAR